MTHVLHRDLRTTLPEAVRGEGAYIVDKSGKRYLDASGGPAVSCLGHSHPKVIAAVQKQVAEMAYAYTLFFTSAAMEQLADRLVAQAPADMDRAFFCSGGAEAVEGAIKLARQYFLEIGQPSRRLYIARQRSYHGNTVGTLSLGTDAVRRAAYEAMLMPVEHIVPCYEYRHRRADETAEAYGLRAAEDLETTIQRLGAENVAAFICEPVVGATLGCVPPTPGYLRRIREICDRHGILLIYDEVITGFGRLGTNFGADYFGVQPDMINFAKCVTNGVIPMGGVICRQGIYDALMNQDAPLHAIEFLHGYTYSGHPVACAAAIATLNLYAQEDLFARAGVQGKKLGDAMHAACRGLPGVVSVRALGLAAAVELEPRGGPGKRAYDIFLDCFARGVLVRSAGENLVFAPPYIVTDAQIDEMVGTLAASIQRNA